MPDCPVLLPLLMWTPRQPSSDFREVQISSRKEWQCKMLCHSWKDHQRNESSTFRSGKLLPLMAKDNLVKNGMCRWSWASWITDRLRLVLHVCDQFWVVSYRSGDCVFLCSCQRNYSVSPINNVNENNEGSQKGRDLLYIRLRKSLQQFLFQCSFQIYGFRTTIQMC